MQRLFDNGYGGFSADGREYIIDWQPGHTTPAPWSNVIANPNFGFLITEAGGGYTWAENSGENRLTPWRNDPVLDPPAEALYFRDEETGAVWSPTPLPAGSSHSSQDGEVPETTRAGERIRIRHGAGYSIFERRSHGLDQSLRLFTTVADPVKIAQIHLTNYTDRPRRLTVTYYAEWVLGPNRETMQTTIVPEFDAAQQALLARNAYNTEFAERTAFVSASQNAHGITADRAEFLGQLGSYARPPALERIGLSGRVEPSLDPCAAYQIHIDLPAGASETVHFLIGQGDNQRHALDLVERYRSTSAVEAAWRDWTQFWNCILETVQVKTPDPAMDLVLNRWLLYQALSCRIWGRSAFYQSSGAFGFRDQLQDVMAALHVLPSETRKQICRSARHQFLEGDVLHWWHPPSGRGVRTRITDDLLWLPFVTAQYVNSTDDESVLWAEEPFLRGEPLQPEEEERYGQYERTEETYTIFEHCRRALDKGWERRSDRGLPLIGGGDWNDGMNRVGIEGKGESIWLGWFFYRCLNDFADLCQRVDQQDDAARYRGWAAALQSAIETHAWDGDWYLRATYDDGTPLGSRHSDECQIDAIAQSWSVISGGGNPTRAQQAMASVYDRLIRVEDRLSLLFTPPFDQTSKDPGYIKGYLPGIRENGGQYTHAAIWTVWAYAMLGKGEDAGQLFNFLNPVNRSQSQGDAHRYMVEPYVVVADIYGVPPHVGRGGWTWYTGSSGWLYRLGLEAILGVRRQGNTLRIEPCIPKEWSGYELSYRIGNTRYCIHVDNSAGVNRGVSCITMDGEITDGAILLTDDGQEHKVVVTLGME
jgi:cyclic beta-1,2-glucan synthetase